MSTDKSISNDSIKKENVGESQKESSGKHDKEVKKGSEINAKIKEAEKIKIKVDKKEIKNWSEKEEPKEVNQQTQNIPKEGESYEALTGKVQNLEKEVKKKDKKLAKKDKKIQYLMDLLKNKFGYVESDSLDKKEENEEEEPDDD